MESQPKPKARVDQYRKQLDDWRKLTKKNNQELAKLAHYFTFDDGYDAEIRDYTISRLITQGAPRPRADARHTVRALLGVFYMLNVLQVEDIRTFLRTYEVYPTQELEDQAWQDFWQRIEAGAEQGRKDLRAIQEVVSSSGNKAVLPLTGQVGTPDEPASKIQSTLLKLTPTLQTSIESGKRESNSLMRQHRYPQRTILVAAVVILILALGIGGFAILALRQNPLSSTATTLPIQGSPAVFSSVCAIATSNATPPFRPDQGFSQFQIVSNAPEASILNNHVRSLAQNANGVWVGYISDGIVSGISYFDKSKNLWVHCSGLPLLSGLTINGFAFIDERMFIAIDAGSDNSNAPGVAQLTKTGWRLYTRDDGLPSNVVYSVTIDHSGTVWATTYEGVAKLVDDRWKLTYSAQPGQLACSDVHRFIDDTEGNRWFALVQCGVSRLSAKGEWASYFTDTDGLKNARAIVTDDQGGVWIATDGGGVLRHYHDTWTTFTQPEIPSKNIQDIQRDKFGRIWIATNGGIAYTADYGKTWVLHSKMPSLTIAFGCPTCAYDEDHLWFALKDLGIGHVHIPPDRPTIRVVSPPPPVKLQPGEKYVFEVEIEMLSEGLHKNTGDSLRNIQPEGTNLYGAWPIIEMRQDEVTIGQKYIFSNVKNPITAPSTPGTYQSSWRVWQGGRFVTDPIIVEFIVGGK